MSLPVLFLFTGPKPPGSKEDAHLKTEASFRTKFPNENQIAVFYTFSYHENLRSVENVRYFLENGFDPDFPVDYFFIQNGLRPPEMPEISFPHAPNIELVRRRNFGLDVCAYHDVLNGVADRSKYRFFFFINSTLRGPFLPSHYTKKWFEAFVDKLSADLRLVGPYLSCQGAPHVQSMMWAMSTETFDLVKDRFVCVDVFSEERKRELIGLWEIGVSQHLLSSGYNIGSLMLAYDGIDFRDPANQRCNGGLNPFVSPSSYYGLTPSPYETVFIKTSGTLKEDVDPFVLKSMELHAFFRDFARQNPGRAPALDSHMDDQ